jgi:hypothetical protein
MTENETLISEISELIKLDLYQKHDYKRIAPNLIGKYPKVLEALEREKIQAKEFLESFLSMLKGDLADARMRVALASRHYSKGEEREQIDLFLSKPENVQLFREIFQRYTE